MPKPTSKQTDYSRLRAVFLLGSCGMASSAIRPAAFSDFRMKFVFEPALLSRFLKAATTRGPTSTQYETAELRYPELSFQAHNRSGLLIDSTGWSFLQVEHAKRNLSELGYDCFGMYANASLKMAKSRNQSQRNKGGRIPDSVVETTWKNSEKDLMKYQSAFGVRHFALLEGDKDLAQSQWSRVVSPSVRHTVTKLLKQPLCNAKGREWLQAQERHPVAALEDEKICVGAE